VVGYLIGKIEKSQFCVPSDRVGKVSSAFILEQHRIGDIEKRAFEQILRWFKANAVQRIELSTDSRSKIGINSWKKFNLFEYQKKIYRNYIHEKLKKFKLSDLMISIEPSNICNGKCIMCPYQK